MGLTFNEIQGRDGKVEVVGLGVVVAIFQRWKLERRGENGSAGPTWTLRASLSYVNDTFIGKKMKWRITLEVDRKVTFLAELLDGVESSVQDGNLVIEGVRAWQK